MQHDETRSLVTLGCYLRVARRAGTADLLDNLIVELAA
jgi:hypothetical protein